MNARSTPQECAQLVDQSLAKLRGGFEVSTSDDACRVITPFLRRDGDRFEITVRSLGVGFWVSDEGDSLDYLELSGINTRTKTFERLVTEVKKAHHVDIERGAIVVRASNPNEVGDAIVRAIAAMNDLSQFELTRRERTPQAFTELVEAELVGLSTPYEPRVVKQGAVRPRPFAFGINGRLNVVIEPLSATSSTSAVQAADVLIVSVLDVWKVDPTIGALAVVDDRRAVWDDRALPDLEGNGLTVVRWSRRHAEMSNAIKEPKRGPHAR